MLLPLLLAGCSDPFTVENGSVQVIAEEDAFTIRNRTASDSLVVVVVERDTAALIDLAPCDTWTNAIAPRSRRRVPYVDVIGYEPAAEAAFVFWCTRVGASVTDGGTLSVPFD